MAHLHEGRPRYHFKPWNVGRWVLWGLFALVLCVAPLIWKTGFALTMLSQMGIAIIACLAYNILLGQGGMLSFGHAVYTGLGSFLAIHTLNMVADGRLALPVSLIPLAGGLGGPVLRRAARLCHDEEGRHDLRDDHAGHRRAGVVDVADDPRILRRRRRHRRPTASPAGPSWASPSARRSRSTT